MKRFAGRKLFSVGKTVYRGEDVLLAGHLGGELSALDRRIREGLAGLRRSEVSEEAAEEAAEAWRYERDLLAADDLESWLDAWGLGFEEWDAYMQREVARSAASGGEATGSDIPDPDVESVAYAEAMCSGVLEAVTRRLAGQAALADVDLRPCAKTRLRTALKALPPGVRKGGLFGLGPAETVERAERIACVRIRSDAVVEDLTVPAVLEREVEAHALDWTRVDCRVVTFEHEGPAREAALIVRQDGLPLRKAAALAHAPVLVARYVIEDLEASLRDRLVGARPGQLVGPLRAGERFVLLSVTGRVEPSVGDPAVHARALDRVVKRTVEREMAKRVRWHEHF